MSGRVVHFEVPFDDAERAAGFYADIFGWDVRAMPELDYTMVTTGPVGDDGASAEPGFINGGMYAREGELTSPVVTIGVADIDAVLARVEALGGSTVQAKADVGGMGYSAYFRDSEGNLMGLWQDA